MPQFPCIVDTSCYSLRDAKPHHELNEGSLLMKKKGVVDGFGGTNSKAI